MGISSCNLCVCDLIRESIGVIWIELLYWNMFYLILLAKKKMLPSMIPNKIYRRESFFWIFPEHLPLDGLNLMHCLILYNVPNIKPIFAKNHSNTSICHQMLNAHFKRPVPACHFSNTRIHINLQQSLFRNKLIILSPSHKTLDTHILCNADSVAVACSFFSLLLLLFDWVFFYDCMCWFC